MIEMITGLTEFKDFALIRKPEVESYTFRGRDFVYWFNITFTEGRIFLTGDCGDNVFTVRETDVAGLKNWLINLDEGYALSKGIHKPDHFDEDFARRQLNIHLLENSDGEFNCYSKSSTNMNNHNIKQPGKND